MTPRLRLPQTIALAGLALVGACSRAPERVAALHVAPATLQLPFPGFETVRIEITPRAELPPGSEPQLFLHLLDEHRIAGRRASPHQHHRSDGIIA